LLRFEDHDQRMECFTTGSTTIEVMLHGRQQQMRVIPRRDHLGQTIKLFVTAIAVNIGFVQAVDAIYQLPQLFAIHNPVPVWLCRAVTDFILVLRFVLY
jgi:hypothetical protein